MNTATENRTDVQTAEQADREALARSLAAKLHVRELSMAHMVCDEPPPRDYLFGAWALTPAVYSLIGAPGDTGKSYLLLTILLTLALAGVRGVAYDPLGLQPKAEPHGNGWPVSYVTGEDSDDEVWRRIYKLTKPMGPEAYIAGQRNLKVLSTQGVAPRVLITDSDFQDYLIAKCWGDRLTGLDTLTRFHDADENSNGEMASVTGCIEHVAHGSGSALLVAHHLAKGAQRDGDGMSGLAFRGASCIRENSRWALLLGRMEDGTLRAHEDKHNNGKPHDDFLIHWTAEGTLERAQTTGAMAAAMAGAFDQKKRAKDKAWQKWTRQQAGAPRENGREE